MATLKFENDTPGKDDEKTYIISQDVKRSQMAKILNRALDRTAWYVNDDPAVADDDWSYIYLPEALEIIKANCQKRGWTISTSPNAPQATPANDWKSDPATTPQLNYLRSLRVDLSPFGDITKWFASQLIEAAKNDNLGSVQGAFYLDGSN